jgi:hypothetical protein
LCLMLLKAAPTHKKWNVFITNSYDILFHNRPQSAICTSKHAGSNDSVPTVHIQITFTNVFNVKSSNVTVLILIVIKYQARLTCNSYPSKPTAFCIYYGCVPFLPIIFNIQSSEDRMLIILQTLLGSRAFVFFFIPIL